MELWPRSSSSSGNFSKTRSKAFRLSARTSHTVSAWVSDSTKLGRRSLPPGHRMTHTVYKRDSQQGTSNQLYVCISTQSDNGDIRIPAFVTFLRTALLLHPSIGNARAVAVAKSAVQVAMTVSFRVCEIPRTAWPPKTLPGWSRLTGWSLPPEKSTANNDQGWHQLNATKPRAPALRSTLHLPKASTLTHLGWCLETPAWW